MGRSAQIHNESARLALVAVLKRDSSGSRFTSVVLDLDQCSVASVVLYSPGRMFPMSVPSEAIKYDTLPLKSGGLTRDSIDTVKSTAPL